MIAGHDKIFNFHDRRQQLAWLAVILAAAFALRLYIALRFPNIHHADEIFQYLEQAHRLVFKYGVAPWEYREGTRSWLVPGFLAGILKLSDVLGLSFPGFYLFLVAATLTALSLSVVLVGFLWASRTQGAFAGVITAALCGLWFELVYFAPKTLTEPIAAHILVIAIYLAYPSQPTSNKRRLFAAGLLFGLVVAIRVHLSPALIVAAMYICGREVRNKWLPIVLGGLTTLLVAGMLDALTWQYPFQSFIANIWVNIVQQKSNQFGVSPWYYFAGKWVLIWGLATVPIALLTIVAVRKNILLGLIAATIVATHMFIGHKEYRFVFPAVPFIIILVGLGTAEIYGYFETKLKSRSLVLAGRIGVILVWALVSAAGCSRESISAVSK